MASKTFTFNSHRKSLNILIFYLDGIRFSNRRENHWAKANKNEMKFPILNNRLLLMRDDRHFSNSDHFGAVNCDGDLSRLFKVKNILNTQAGPSLGLDGYDRIFR